MFRSTQRPMCQAWNATDGALGPGRTWTNAGATLRTDSSTSWWFHAIHSARRSAQIRSVISDPPSSRSVSPPVARRYPALHSTAMDLHVIGPLASPAERAAVDAVLGPAESAWRGGARDPKTEGHVARGGHDAEVPPRPPDPGSPRRSVAARLDQPARAQLRLPPPQCPPGRGIRRRHVLRPLCDEAAPTDRRPRLRRHRLPARGRRRPDSRSRTDARTSRCAHCRRERDLAAIAVPWSVRAGAGRHVHDRWGAPADPGRGAGRRGRRRARLATAVTAADPGPGPDMRTTVINSEGLSGRCRHRGRPVGAPGRPTRPPPPRPRRGRRPDLDRRLSGERGLSGARAEPGPSGPRPSSTK